MWIVGTVPPYPTLTTIWHVLAAAALGWTLALAFLYPILKVR